MSNLLLTIKTLGDRLWQSRMLHMIVLARRLSVTLTAQYLSLVNASLLVYECMPVSVIVSDCQGVSRCQYQPDGTQDLWLLTTKHQTRYYCQQSQQFYRVCEMSDQGLRQLDLSWYRIFHFDTIRYDISPFSKKKVISDMNSIRYGGGEGGK